MRNVLLAPVLASLVLSSTPADACGPYVPEPTIFQLSSHLTRTGVDLASRSTRTFVLTGKIDRARAARLAWQTLAPRSYDHARVALDVDLARPMEVTLIGPAGTKVVSSKRRAFLDQTFVQQGPSSALEIDVEPNKYRFAIKGRHERARWIALDDGIATTTADLAWVKKQGVTPIDPQYVYVGKLAGTQLETISVLAEGSGMVTLVRSGHALYAQLEGSPRGAVEVAGQRYLVAVADGRVTSVWL